MTPTITFLTSLGQTFAALSLYGEGHPMRQQALERLVQALHQLLRLGPFVLSFVDGDVIVGTRPVTDMRGWDWGARFAAVGIQRLEFSPSPRPELPEVTAMLTEMRRRLVAPDGSSEPWQRGGIRFGPLALYGGTDAPVEPSSPSSPAVGSLLDALATSGLAAETEAVEYINAEVAAGRQVPMVEVEAVVHGLALTIHREQDVVLPLLDLRNFDEYTTTHSCNVAMLSLGLAEQLGLADADARAIGVAALLHDIGKMRLPQEVLTKPGKLTGTERKIIETHPVEGGRILSGRGLGNSLAATVAYEHHIWFNGQGGYPRFGYPRTTHYASRIVHVCDIYDALCSIRPYRAAWPRARALGLLQSIAGVELDPEVTAAFVAMANAATEARQHLTAGAA